MEKVVQVDEGVDYRTGRGDESDSRRAWCETISHWGVVRL
jgi:hypothetical protein